MQNLNLTEEELKEVLKILKPFRLNVDILAYGSRVLGTNHTTSDLDLVIRNRTNPETAFKQLNQLKQAFEDSQLPIFVDITDWSRLPLDFRQEIQKKYIVI